MLWSCCRCPVCTACLTAFMMWAYMCCMCSVPDVDRSARLHLLYIPLCFTSTAHLPAHVCQLLQANLSQYIAACLSADTTVLAWPTVVQAVSSVGCCVLQDAAKALDVGLSVMKRACRNLGLARWPYRTRSSLRAVIEKTERYLVCVCVSCNAPAIVCL